MQFTAAALLALVASVVAQNPDFNPITRPSEKEEVAEGSTFTIQWSAPEAFADVTVAISLIGGPEQNLQQPLTDIASGVKNSDESYEWTVPGDLAGFPWYGIKIASEANPEDFQFSNPFLVVADPNADPSSSSTTTVTVTTASGTATVTLSVASVSSSAVISSSSSAEESSSAVESTSSEVVSSSSVAPPTTIQTTTTSAPPASSPTESDSAEESEPAQVPDNAGTQAKAGLFALVGGLAVALML